MRRCMRTSNYIERLNREVKRRSKVMGILPSADSAARLMGAVLMEENERWSTVRQTYYSPAYEELERTVPRLAKIASIQRELRKAA